MRVLYFVHGLGLGHAYRSRPIIQELKKQGNEIVVASYGKAKGVFENDYKTYQVPEIGSIYVKNDGEISITGSIIENLKNMHPIAVNKISKIISEVKPEVVVVDGYILAIVITKLKGLPVVNVANCTNLGYVFSSDVPVLSRGSDVVSKYVVEVSDKVIIADFPPPFTISKHNINTYGFKDKFNFVGPTVEGRRRNKRDTILVTMGGSDITTKLNIQLEDYEILQTNGELSYEEILDLIGKSKGIITHGGHTTIMSALKSNTPTIVIPLEEYTERLNNGRGVDEMGTGKLILEGEVTKEGLEMALEYITSNHIRKNVEFYSRWAEKLKGAQRAADLIQSINSI